MSNEETGRLSAGIDEETLQWILKNLDGLKYGTVHITVHQGKIVQIDRTEKIRFDK
ncbi:YezD family protein [Paenibacillus humicola]|uniref:YezD family protein n=1 Tax=Paenibacillus humicola TaxID=3110540 RepID=UPI00237A3582|nr:YezD family protein [Paenibacillus humicola]